MTNTPNPVETQRFMLKVDMNGPLPAHDPSLGNCWRWRGSKSVYGYGRAFARGAMAHRWSYQKFVGPVPEGMVLDHLCHDPESCRGGKQCQHRACVNPSHLAVTTAGENVLRGGGTSAVNARKTHCIRGHEFTPENTEITKGGWSGVGRSCKQCAKDRREAKRRAGLPVGDRRHGTMYGYVYWACRCDACSGVRREYERDRRAEKKR